MNARQKFSLRNISNNIPRPQHDFLRQFYKTLLLVAFKSIFHWYPRIKIKWSAKIVFFESQSYRRNSDCLRLLIHRKCYVLFVTKSSSSDEVSTYHARKLWSCEKIFQTTNVTSTLIFWGSNFSLLIQPSVVKSSGTTAERCKRHPT